MGAVRNKDIGENRPPETRKALWTCPKCGHRFVTRNIWHSCSNYSLEGHFVGKEPAVREVFNKLLGLIEQCGPVTVIPQHKTRIAIQARVRFAGGVARKNWFDAGHFPLGPSSSWFAPLLTVMAGAALVGSLVLLVRGRQSSDV